MANQPNIITTRPIKTATNNSIFNSFPHLHNFR